MPRSFHSSSGGGRMELVVFVCSRKREARGGGVSSMDIVVRPTSTSTCVLVSVCCCLANKHDALSLSVSRSVASALLVAGGGGRLAPSLLALRLCPSWGRFAGGNGAAMLEGPSAECRMPLSSSPSPSLSHWGMHCSARRAASVYLVFVAQVCAPRLPAAIPHASLPPANAPAATTNLEPHVRRPKIENDNGNGNQRGRHARTQCPVLQRLRQLYHRYTVFALSRLAANPRCHWRRLPASCPTQTLNHTCTPSLKTDNRHANTQHLPTIPNSTAWPWPGPPPQAPPRSTRPAPA
jgi:hypothetical protein